VPVKNKNQKYDLWIRAAIARTQNPDLFPDLRIPRTTANYWIKQGCSVDDPAVEALTEVINDSRLALDQNRQALVEKDALVSLVKEIFRTFGFSLRWKHVDSSDTKYKILSAIESAMTQASRESCLNAIELSLSRYKRWPRGNQNLSQRDRQSADFPRDTNHEKPCDLQRVCAFSDTIFALLRKAGKSLVLFLFHLAKIHHSL
jgi:hypothetical protein